MLKLLISRLSSCPPVYHFNPSFSNHLKQVFNVKADLCRLSKSYHRWKPKPQVIHRFTASSVIEDTRLKQNRLRRLKETREQLKETKDVIKGKLVEMKENVFTYPNGLCVVRIALTPFLAYSVLIADYKMALGVFMLAGTTDLLDGYIARNFENQKSVLGSFLDPFADKLLIATLFATLTYTGLIPIALTSLIIARDSVLLGSGFYIRYKSLPAPKTMKRYFDITMPTAQISPTMISKINTSLQLFLVAASLGAPVFDYVHHPALQCLWYTTAATTLLSAFSYINSKNTYTFISKSRHFLNKIK